jgi:hypothetical protein
VIERGKSLILISSITFYFQKLLLKQKSSSDTSRVTPLPRVSHVIIFFLHMIIFFLLEIISSLEIGFKIFSHIPTLGVKYHLNGPLSGVSQPFELQVPVKDKFSSYCSGQKNFSVLCPSTMCFRCPKYIDADFA